MAKLFNGPFLPRELDVSSGIAIASGYYVRTYEPDGAFTTLKAVYIDAAQTTPHANPFQINASGFPTAGPVYWDGLIDFKVYDGDPDGDGNEIRSVENAGDNRSAIATDLQNLIQNASFETDADSDGDPDNWTLVEPANITIARNSTSPGHGGSFALFTVSGAGTAHITSEYFEVSAFDTLIGGMMINSSVATINVRAQLLFYDEDQAYTGTSQLVYNSTDNPTSWGEIRFSAIKVGDVESTARYAQLRILVVDNAQTGTVGIDGVWMTVRRNAVSPFAPNGLQLSRDSGDTAHDINITAGSVRADDGEYDLYLETEITKQMDASFASGDDAGGTLSGFTIPADGVIAVWLFENSSTGQRDIGFDNSFTSPNLPAGYDKKRYIGAWATDNANDLLDGVMRGDHYWKLGDFEPEFQDTTITDAVVEESGTLNCPPHALVHFMARVEILSGSATEIIGWVRPHNGSWATSKMGTGSESTDDATDEIWWEGVVYVGEDAKIDYGVDFAGHGGSVQMDFYIKGWLDLLREAA